MIWIYFFFNSPFSLCHFSHSENRHLAKKEFLIHAARTQNTIRTITVDEVKHTDCYVPRDKHGYSKKKKKKKQRRETKPNRMLTVDERAQRLLGEPTQNGAREHDWKLWFARMWWSESRWLVGMKQKKIHKNQNHRRLRRPRRHRSQSFYTHTQIFLLSLITERFFFFLVATVIYMFLPAMERYTRVIMEVQRERERGKVNGVECGEQRTH